jgi:hypothetical protein
MKKIIPPIEEIGTQICYVCKKKISAFPVYIGKDTYRHIRCQPGGLRWLRSERGEKSEVAEFFGEKKEDV